MKLMIPLVLVSAIVIGCAGEVSSDPSFIQLDLEHEKSECIRLAMLIERHIEIGMSAQQVFEVLGKPTDGSSPDTAVTWTKLGSLGPTVIFSTVDYLSNEYEVRHYISARKQCEKMSVELIESSQYHLLRINK